MHNDAKTNYITSILRLVSLLSTFIYGSNTFIWLSEWPNNTGRYDKLKILQFPIKIVHFLFEPSPVGAENGLTREKWETLNVNGVVSDSEEVYRLVYFGGCDHDIRKEVWPFLLGHYSFGSTAEERAELDETSRHYYETTMSEWLAVEAIVRQRDKEKTAVAVAKLSSESGSDNKAKQSIDPDNDIENDVFEENDFSDLSDPEECNGERKHSVGKKSSNASPAEVNEKPSRENKSSTDSGNVPDSADEEMTNKCNGEPLKEANNNNNNNNPNEDAEMVDVNGVEDKESVSSPSAVDKDVEVFNMAIDGDNVISNKSSPSTSSYETVANDFVDLAERIDDINMDTTEINVSSPTCIVTDASIDIVNIQRNEKSSANEAQTDNENVLSPLQEEVAGQSSLDALQEPKSACVSPASSNGGIYSVSTNIQRKIIKTLLFDLSNNNEICRVNFWKRLV